MWERLFSVDIQVCEEIEIFKVMEFTKTAYQADNSCCEQRILAGETERNEGSSRRKRLEEFFYGFCEKYYGSGVFAWDYR